MRSEGVVTIRYPRRLWVLGGGRRGAGHAQRRYPVADRNPGGASEVTAELGGLNLTGLEVKGGLSMIRLELPAPSGVNFSSGSAGEHQ